VSEAQTLNQILLACSQGPTRLMRVNAGQAWAGVIVKRTATTITLLNPYPVKLAHEGVSDLLGWTTVDERAIFTAIEAKFGRNKPTDAQLSFIDAVVKAGGRAGVAYSTDDARRIIAAKL